MTPQKTNALLLVCALQYTSSCLYLQDPAFAADFSGPVVSVLDGDTIEALHNTRAERIRLSGIDCPEKGQPYGRKPSTPPQSWSMEKSHASDLRQGQVRAHPC